MRGIKVLVKYFLVGIMFSFLFIVVGLILNKVKGYNVADVIFIEGLISIIIGVFSLSSANSMGLPMQSLGQNNTQYISNANLEVSRREKRHIVKNISLNTVSLIIAGAICIISSIII